MELERLTKEWPLCHDEYMSIRTRAQCDKCNTDFKHHFPSGRLPLDQIPGTYEKRVFIGGNYELMSALRDIKNAVKKLDNNFVPILAYDDFQIPAAKIYEWDLRLLHNCKYAIFDVTSPAGELFEIARTEEYHVKTLLVYQSRGATMAPPRARTMLLESGTHEHHSYTESKQLESIVRDFLWQKRPSTWARSVEQTGYHFKSCKIHTILDSKGNTDYQLSFTGLTVDSSASTLSEITHDYRLTQGAIISGSFKVNGKGVTWIRNPDDCGKRSEGGVVRFRKPIRKGNPPVDYSVQLKTIKAYALNMKDLMKLRPEERDDPMLSIGYEYASREIAVPMEEFTIVVEFPKEFDIDPQPMAFFGSEKRDDGFVIPPDSFTFCNNVAKLVVNMPRMNYKYAIAWKVPGT